MKEGTHRPHWQLDRQWQWGVQMWWAQAAGTKVENTEWRHTQASQSAACKHCKKLLAATAHGHEM